MQKVDKNTKFTQFTLNIFSYSSCSTESLKTEWHHINFDIIKMSGEPLEVGMLEKKTTPAIFTPADCARNWNQISLKAKVTLPPLSSQWEMTSHKPYLVGQCKNQAQ